MSVVQLQAQLRRAHAVAAEVASARGNRLDPRIAEARVRQLAAEGLSHREIANRLGLTKGQVSGILFRARGGARQPRGPQRKTREAKAPSFRPPLLNGHDPGWQRMTDADKDRQFAAMTEFDGTFWWVMIPDKTWPGLGRRPIRERGNRTPEVKCVRVEDARRLAHEAWGFY